MTSAVDLRANAIITAIDRYSGPIRNMAGATGALIRRADQIGNAARRTGSALAGPMAFGLGAVIYRTQEFEKKALGARIATIADAMERVTDEFGRDHVLIDTAKIAREGGAIKNAALATSKLLGVSPTGLMEAGEAAGKMGLELKKAESVMRTSGILRMADPKIDYESASEFLTTSGILFKAPQDIEGYAQFIREAGDKIQVVASATRTSVSKMQEGFRQFAPVFASFGATIDQAGALLGTMVQAGLMDTESGTALKSAALRFVRPTLEGLSAMSAVGIDRRNYMNLTGADPRRATNQLMQLFTGYLNKGDKMWLIESMSKAQKTGTGSDPAFIDQVAAYVNKRTNGKETLEDTYLKVLNAITTSGGKVNIFKYLQDVAELIKAGKISDAQLATIFEGRHIARMKGLLGHPDETQRIYGLAQMAQGQGLDAVVEQYRQSSFGQWETTMASFDRALVRLRESKGIQNVIMSFEKLADAVASFDQKFVEGAGYAAAGLLSLAAVGTVLGASATALKGLRALGGFALGPVGIATGAGYLGYEAWNNWDAIKEKASKMWDFLGMGGADKAAAAAASSNSEGAGGLPPLARTTSELIAAISAPREVQVTGEAKLKIDVDIKGLPAGVTATPTTSGDRAIPLRTGTSMGDLGVP